MQMKATYNFLKPYKKTRVHDEPDCNHADVKKNSYSSIFLCIFLVACSIFSFSINAVNIVTYSISDSVTNHSEILEMQCKSISNENNKIRISFVLKSANTPFTIYKTEWVNQGIVIAPVEPFSLIAQTKEVNGKSTEWHISIDFPFSDSFDENDVLILYTDKGIIRCPTSRAGALREIINIMHDDYEKQLDRSKANSRKAWLISTIILSCVIIVSCIAFIIVRRRLIQKHKKIEELSLLLSERTGRNIELEAKVDALYGNRLNTLNMLCNEYFEKSGSEKLKLTLSSEVEKYILSLRDTKNIVELENIVNTYLNNILSRAKEQLPCLNRKDLVFLTYLYAGFSPRAICIFTDIKIKNYYNRRSRLKDRILASDAPDREYFVSKM